MKVKLSVAVLAACSALAMAMPVSAQFKDLKSFKKVLETAKEVLEEPKPTAQPQPEPAARSAPPQSPVSAPIAAPMREQQAGSVAVSDEPQVVGQRPPANLQAGTMPAAVKSGLMKVDNCFYFEDKQGQGETIVEFINYQGSIETVMITDKSIFKNIGIQNLNLKSRVTYLGATSTDYYFEISFAQDKPISIIGMASKEGFSNSPWIEFDFGSNKTAACYVFDDHNG